MQVVLIARPSKDWSGEQFNQKKSKMNDLTLDDELGLLWYQYTQTGDDEKLAEYERLRKFQKIWKENFRIL